MKILIFGSNSKTGKALRKQAANTQYEYVWVSSKPINDLPELHSYVSIPSDGDLENEVVRILDDNMPNVVVNLIAYTDVDGCESNVEKSRSLNFKVPEILAEWSFVNNAKLIHISTDYVYNGDNGPYDINDPTSDVNLCKYAEDKRDSEKIVLELGGCVIRTNVLYSTDPDIDEGFLKWLRTRFNDQDLKQISIVDDQYNNPCSVEDLSRSIMSVINKGITGIIHAGGRDWLSRYHMAIVAKILWGYSGISINRIKTLDLKQLANRPKYGGLVIKSSEKLLDLEYSGVYDYLLDSCNSNPNFLNDSLIHNRKWPIKGIFVNLIDILRNIPINVWKSSNIDISVNGHGTISIFIKFDAHYSEIEVGLNSMSAILSRSKENSVELLGISDNLGRISSLLDTMCKYFDGEIKSIDKF